MTNNPHNPHERQAGLDKAQFSSRMARLGVRNHPLTEEQRQAQFKNRSDTMKRFMEQRLQEKRDTWWTNLP